ncbi:UNVERIFIED_CONTAM: hypothetical protein Slati_3058500 [Sesamum latifolium]|uniref:Reverse transcriptase n=1 Tax=Sesamum latifolium TaxID=2727402 RepID=A0AAW2UYW6_9LAMI
MHNWSEQDAYISLVPNSLPEETPPQTAGIVRRPHRGENSQRSQKEQPQAHTNSENSCDSEGEEELTLISNRFQSLEDMETEDILQHIEKRNSRRILWEELTWLSTQDVPWLVGRDFNVILHPNENQGGDLSRMGPMDDFNDMVSDTGLIDAGFEGEPFTWINKRIWKRLDRVLYGKEWAKILNNTRVMHLPRRLSDHHPLFIHTVKTENKSRHHSESEYWKQKSSCKWLEADERNTKFFHSLMKKKRIRSTIHRIIEGNQEVTNSDQIRDSAARYFENLLSGNPNRHDRSNFPFQFSQLLLEAAHNICNIPEMEEIKNIVFSIDKDSVAGPDGFSSAFYQACWDFIAIDIQDAVRDFFCGTPMPRSFKATTIVLIPKVDSPQTWNDFRPI